MVLVDGALVVVLELEPESLVGVLPLDELPESLELDPDPDPEVDEVGQPDDAGSLSESFSM